MLRSLSRMPADLSSESRRQLLNAVTDLFLLDDEPTAAASEHYGEIAIQSLSHLAAPDRKAYGDQVAATPSLPKDVALTIARDQNADVARLMLKLSPVLTDTDLAAIAVTQSQEHLVAIAERARLSEGLTEILVERGDRVVLHTVSANEGAQFSDKGFDRILERSVDDLEIGQTLAKRSDLTPNRSERVLRIVEHMSDQTGSWAKPNDEAASLTRQARLQRLEVKLLMADLVVGSRTLDDVVIMLADDDRAYHLAQVIGQAADITSEQALRVLMQRDTSGIAVTCRSLDVSPDAFKSVLSLRTRRLFFAAKDVDDDLRDYARLDTATSDRTMRFLKLKTKLG